MSDMDDFPEFPLDLERLLTEAVMQALRDEDPVKFQKWLRGKLPEFADSELRGAPRQLLNAMAAQLGLAIWNALPLPGNNFQPRPLPLPGRNDPCPCGSGRKYKKCCSTAPPPPPLDSLALWPLVLENLSLPRATEAVRQGRVPAEALVETAAEWIDEDRPQDAVELLQPLFDTLSKRTRQFEGLALQTLCDAYELLDRHADRTALLERVTAEAPRSPLRAAAWQRLAAIRLNEDDIEGARKALEQAMRDDPDEPAAVLIELQLLAREERWEQARERSRFWLKKLRRPIYDPEIIAPLLEILEQVLEDPEGALTALSSPVEEFEEDFEEPEALDEGVERLLAWADSALQRPLPDYRVVKESDSVEEADNTDQLARQLRGMGVAGEEIPDALEMMKRQLEEMEADFEEDTSTATADGDFSHILLPPAHLRPIEDRWSELAPPKPFGIGNHPEEPWEGWDFGQEEPWLAFLEQHPEAGDSLEVLDDVVSAMFLYPDRPQAALFFEGIHPLLERAQDIVERALAATAEPRLLWNRIENRPALRSLVRLYGVQRYTFENEDEADQLSELMLRLNPGDNHGLRAVVMNDYLRRGQDEQAVELAQRFPEDVFAETRYGLVLALYRLNRLQSAQVAAEQAVGELPLVARYLVRARINKPEISGYGMRPGGEDQAWIYREKMRDVWQNTPGALAFLKKIMKFRGVGAYQ